jgi:hypothetical protein
MERPRETFQPLPHNTELYRRMNDAVYRNVRLSTDQVLERSWPLFH